MEVVHKRSNVGKKSRERSNASWFRIEKTTSKCRYIVVLRFLINLCHRPAIRFGLRRDPRGRFRDPSFSSFMADSNRRPLDHDMHDAVLKGRKAMKGLFKVGLALGGAWVVIESAKALSIF
jgi:hypothetical protein